MANNFDRVCWSKFDDMGFARNYGKEHLIDDTSEKTLCGLDIPSFQDGYDVTSHQGDAMCKRCLKKQKLLREGQ